MRYVCIDKNEVRDKLPKYINSVPSLVVGETNQIFVGNQIIGWLKMQPIIKNNQQNIYSPKQAHSQNQVTQQPQQQYNNQKKVVKEENGPNAWHNNEMNAFSDMYSFIGIDSSAKGDGGMSMIHNFETISGNAANVPSGLGLMPGGAPSNPSMPVQYGNPVSNPIETSGFGSIQLSEKSDILNKQMEDMMSKRELDVPNVPSRI
tara:strand:+ start:354 stop:965 length:612 start_codon:yes stop_codon:yes gene_type:complete